MCCRLQGRLKGCEVGCRVTDRVVLVVVLRVLKPVLKLAHRRAKQRVLRRPCRRVSPSVRSRRHSPPAVFGAAACAVFLLPFLVVPLDCSLVCKFINHNQMGVQNLNPRRVLVAIPRTHRCWEQHTSQIKIVAPFWGKGERCHIYICFCVLLAGSWSPRMFITSSAPSIVYCTMLLHQQMVSLSVFTTPHYTCTLYRCSMCG